MIRWCYKKSGRYYSRPFRMEIGLIQGDLVYPTVFNIVVEEMLRVVLVEFGGPQEAQYGLVWVTGDHNIVFNAIDSRIAGRNPTWVQMTMTEVVQIFNRVGLQATMVNAKAMVCTP